jgi:phosphoserine phosphatase
VRCASRHGQDHYNSGLVFAHPDAPHAMNLVIQSPDPIADTHLRPLAALARSRHTERTSASRLRLRDADALQRPDIEAYCGPHRLDYAFMAENSRLTDFGLIAMDMDSTLITIECIDEIADFCGLKKEVAAITEASMRGEIKDFDESLTRRVALLKGLDAGALERVYDERRTRLKSSMGN